MDGNGASIILLSEIVKKGIKEGKLKVCNLKLTTDNKLVTIKPKNLPRGLQFIQDKLEYEEYRKHGKIKGCSVEYVINEAEKCIELFRVHKVINNTFEIPSFVSEIKLYYDKELGASVSPFSELGGKLKVINKHNRIKVMHSLFYYCSKLTEIDLSEFDMTGVTNVNNMFAKCGISNFDGFKAKLVSVKYMNSMFYMCERLREVDISKWVVPNVETTYSMFSFATHLERIKLPSDGFPKLVNAKEMFFNCNSLREIKMGSRFKLSQDYIDKDMFYGVNLEIKEKWKLKKFNN